MYKVKYMMYCAKCAINNIPTWDYITWLSGSLFVKGWR